MSNVDIPQDNSEFLNRALEILIRIGAILLLVAWCIQIVRPFLVPVLWGVIITLPAILGYTVFAYRVFWGKTRELSYD